MSARPGRKTLTRRLTPEEKRAAGLHTTTVRWPTHIHAHLAAYARQHDLSDNFAAAYLVGLALESERLKGRFTDLAIGVGCDYARTVKPPPDAPCDGPIDQLIVYTATSGRILTQDPVCRGHAEDALNQLKTLAKQPNLTFYQRSRVDARITQLTPEVLALRKRGTIDPEAPDSLSLHCCR